MSFIILSRSLMAFRNSRELRLAQQSDTNCHLLSFLLSIDALYAGLLWPSCLFPYFKWLGHKKSILAMLLRLRSQSIGLLILT